MSLLWVLRKYIDSIGVREEEAQHRRHREAKPADPEDDDTAIVIEKPPEKAPPTYRCRVCSQVGTDADFCPSCLAGTMEPIRSNST